MAKKKPTRPDKRHHLPDCMSLRTRLYDNKECDCGYPAFPIGNTNALVRRYSVDRDGLQLMVVPKSQVYDGERDLAASELQFESDTRSWIKQQLAADERASRSAGFGKNVWA